MGESTLNPPIPAPNELLEGPILSSLLTLAIPIIVANILHVGHQVIDAFWVGRLNGAAVSVSFPIIFLLTAVGAGLDVYSGAFGFMRVSFAALITFGVYAKGDWKKKRPPEPEEALAEKVAADIFVEEGAR